MSQPAAQIIYKVNNKQLPDSIQWLFRLRDAKYDLRGTLTLKNPGHYTALETIIKFKRLFKISRFDE